MRWYHPLSTLVLLLFIAVSCSENRRWGPDNPDELEVKLQNGFKWFNEEQKRVKETKQIAFPSEYTMGERTVRNPFYDYYKVYKDTKIALLEGEIFDTTPDNPPYVPHRTHFCFLSHMNAGEGHIPRGPDDAPVTRYYPEAGKRFLRSREEEKKILEYNGVPLTPEQPKGEEIASRVYEYMGRESSAKEGVYVGWYDARGRYIDTHFNYALAKEVGPGGIYVRDPKTGKFLFHKKFNKAIKRNVGANYSKGKTRWSHIWWEEVGANDDPGYTRWCPRCGDVSTYPGLMVSSDTYIEMLKKTVYGVEGIIAPEILNSTMPVGRIPFGHICGETKYSRVWLTAVPIRPPLSKIDYRTLDKKHAPDNDLHIWGTINRGSDPPVKVSKVDERKVVLTADDMRLINRLDRTGWIEWLKWVDEKTGEEKGAKEIMLENCIRVPKEVARKIDEKVGNFIVDEAENVRIKDLMYQK